MKTARFIQHNELISYKSMDKFYAIQPKRGVINGYKSL